MHHIVEKKLWFFIISLVIIIPGIISLLLFGLDRSIDFTGGTRIQLQFPKTITQQTKDDISKVFVSEKLPTPQIQVSGKEVFLKTAPLSDAESKKILEMLSKKVGTFKQEEFATVGPTVGKEITLNALKAVAISSLLIVLYIAYSFRAVPLPTSSWKFGVCTIIALLHDVLVLLGLFSLLGHFFHVEIDSLFVTAVLTVIGFSVHDTIVVFDRIRENLKKVSGVPFPKVVNDSILQTLGRSLNTSLTALLVLSTLLIFGGESIRWFIVALFIGIASGTYSSIFNAAPLLVLWEEIDAKRKGTPSKKK
jgi:preprotein translocase subunit SecF